jgi:hypothetical protein
MEYSVLGYQGGDVQYPGREKNDSDQSTQMFGEGDPSETGSQWAHAN